MELDTPLLVQEMRYRRSHQRGRCLMNELLFIGHALVAPPHWAGLCKVPP